MMTDRELSEKLGELRYQRVDPEGRIADAFGGVVTGLEIVAPNHDPAVYFAIVRLEPST